MHRYKTYNGPMSTSAALPAVATGTAIKTMLQLATPSTRQIQLYSWGFSIDDPAGADCVFELIEGDTAATVTAHVASGLVKLAGAAQPASLLTVGTTATGYTASGEGSAPTGTRTFDVQSGSSVSAEAAALMVYEKIWMPDERPIMDVSRFLRVRATTPTTGVDMRCWIVWDE